MTFIAQYPLTIFLMKSQILSKNYLMSTTLLLLINLSINHLSFQISHLVLEKRVAKFRLLTRRLRICKFKLMACSFRILMMSKFNFSSYLFRARQMNCKDKDKVRLKSLRTSKCCSYNNNNSSSSSNSSNSSRNNNNCNNSSSNSNYNRIFPVLGKSQGF